MTPAEAEVLAPMRLDDLRERIEELIAEPDAVMRGALLEGLLAEVVGRVVMRSNDWR